MHRERYRYIQLQQGEGLDLGEVRLRAPVWTSFCRICRSGRRESLVIGSTSFELSGTIGVTVLTRLLPVSRPSRYMPTRTLPAKVCRKGNRLFSVITVQASPDSLLTPNSTRCHHAAFRRPVFQRCPDNRSYRSKKFVAELQGKQRG